MKYREEALRKQIRALERARPLCPDCRDKCSQVECLRCEIQRLQNLVDLWKQRTIKASHLIADLCVRLHPSGQGWQLKLCGSDEWVERRCFQDLLDECIEKDPT